MGHNSEDEYKKFLERVQDECELRKSEVGVWVVITRDKNVPKNIKNNREYVVIKPHSPISKLAGHRVVGIKEYSKEFGLQDLKKEPEDWVIEVLYVGRVYYHMEIEPPYGTLETTITSTRNIENAKSYPSKKAADDAIQEYPLYRATAVRRL